MIPHQAPFADGAYGQSALLNLRESREVKFCGQASAGARVPRDFMIFLKHFIDIRIKNKVISRLT